MKLNRFFYLILVLTLFVTGCRKQPTQILSKDAPKIIQYNTAFAVDIYQQLRSSEGNLFLSPYSISSCLAMTYAGARDDTEKQMAQALHFTLDQKELHPGFAALQAGLNKIQEKGDVKLNIANSLWPHKDYTFLDEYLSLTKKYYGVSIKPVNLSNAAGIINKWVEDKTEGKIQNIITQLPGDAVLVLVNAIYFKGQWKNKFPPKDTQGGVFNVTLTSYVKVSMMRKTMNAMYTEDEQLQILELPYVGENISMLILLPKEIDGLEKLENSLSVENLDIWRNKLEKTKIRIFLPSFKMTCRYDLIPTFQNMGMVEAFGAADFSGMTGKRDLFISQIVHKAFVAVNEKGTEAAAATAVGVSGAMRRGQTQPLIFRADHPFLFLIQDKQTGSILFIGRLKDPTKTGELPI
jgi:serpin B